jgi:hypothetical protein
MSARKHAVKVSLNSGELARLDRARGRTERAVYLRTLLYQPPDISEIATHAEALAILSNLARAAPPPRSRSSALFAITRGATTLTTSSQGCSTTNNRAQRGGGPFYANGSSRVGRLELAGEQLTNTRQVDYWIRAIRAVTDLDARKAPLERGTSSSVCFCPRLRDRHGHRVGDHPILTQGDRGGRELHVDYARRPLRVRTRARGGRGRDRRQRVPD